MLKRAKKWGLAAVLGAGMGLSAGGAWAAPVLTSLVVDFEDLAFSGYSTQPSTGYQGFTWGNGIHVQCGEPGGTNCGTVNASTNQYASTAGRTTSKFISRTDGSGFYFDGGDFWSRRGADAVGDFYFILYGQNSQVLYQGDNKDLTPSGKEEKMVLSGQPTDMDLNYGNLIFGMSFIFDNDDYDHFAFDNLAFRVFVDSATTGSEPGNPAGGTGGTGGTGSSGTTEPVLNTVPEPASMALVAMGLGVLGWTRRRSKV